MKNILRLLTISFVVTTGACLAMEPKIVSMQLKKSFYSGKEVKSYANTLNEDRKYYDDCDLEKEMKSSYKRRGSMSPDKK